MAFHLSSAVALLFYIRTNTFDSGAGTGCVGNDGVQYCTLEHALSLPAHHRQLGQTARPAGAMCNDPHNHDLQALAVRCAVLPLFVLTCLQGVLRPLAAIFAQDIGLAVGAFCCNLHCLGHA